MWNNIFQQAFEFVKNDIIKYYENLKEELTPNEKALIEGVKKLPMPVDIIDIKVDNVKYTHLRDDTSQLIKYQMDGIGKKDVTYHGTVNASTKSIENALNKKFNLSEKDAKLLADDLTQKFEYTGFGAGDNTYIQFTRYDIRKNIDEFCDDLRKIFYSTFSDYIIRKFKIEKEKDFNKLYDLKNDPILSTKEILSPDPRSTIPLDRLQRVIADIQLISQVPEPVRNEFQRAKDLFVFSYFKYEFFSISISSVLFAYETAMKMRYMQSLNKKVIITYKADIVHQLTDPTYSDLSKHLYNMRNKLNRDFKDLRVNGEKFPFTMKEVMKWLVENVAPKWKLKMYDAVIKLRNSVAHPEKPFILPPSDGVLRNFAYDINEMYSDK